jgi:hypothetical protein
MRQKSGFALIVAIIVLLVFAVLGVVAVSIMTGENISALRDYNSIRAFQLAEAGIRYTIAASLAADSDWSDNTGFTKTLGAGTFTIAYTSLAKKKVTLLSTGTVGGISRVIGTGYTKKGGYPSQFGDYVGYGGQPGAVGHELHFDNWSQCIGNLYYYGPIRMTGSPKQSGGIIKSHSIDPTPDVGIPTFYEAWEHIETVDPITLESTYYTNWINAANVSTTAAWSGNVGTVNLNGGTRYYRDININAGTINGPGTICATNNPSGGGEINISGTLKINGFVRLISNGSSGNGVTFAPTSPNPIFSSSVEVIAKQFIYVQNSTATSRESLMYANGNDGKFGIQIQDDAQVRGSFLAPNGVLRIMNDSILRGLIYAGSMWTQDFSRFYGSSWYFLDMTGGSQVENWSWLIQSPEDAPSTLPPGILGGSSGSWEVDPWAEAF